jgi:hypothetical protein
MKEVGRSNCVSPSAGLNIEHGTGAMSKILTGALAGFAATFPMTAAMTAMHRLLPKREQYPLPPKQTSDLVYDAPPPR